MQTLDPTDDDDATAVQTWMDSGKYLPEPLRDFHDQKDVFKAMHQTIDVEGHDYAKTVSWVAGQCYVIDIFLWFMARRGWTLQRSRKQLTFNDLDAEVRDMKAVRRAEAYRVTADTTPPPADSRSTPIPADSRTHNLE